MFLPIDLTIHLIAILCLSVVYLMLCWTLHLRALFGPMWRIAGNGVMTLTKEAAKLAKPAFILFLAIIAYSLFVAMFSNLWIGLVGLILALFPLPGLTSIWKTRSLPAPNDPSQKV